MTMFKPIDTVDNSVNRIYKFNGLNRMDSGDSGEFLDSSNIDASHYPCLGVRKPIEQYKLSDFALYDYDNTVISDTSKLGDIRLFIPQLNNGTECYDSNGKFLFTGVIGQSFFYKGHRKLYDELAWAYSDNTWGGVSDKTIFTKTYADYIKDTSLADNHYVPRPTVTFLKTDSVLSYAYYNNKIVINEYKEDNAYDYTLDIKGISTDGKTITISDYLTDKDILNCICANVLINGKIYSILYATAYSETADATLTLKTAVNTDVSLGDTMYVTSVDTIHIGSTNCNMYYYRIEDIESNNSIFIHRCDHRMYLDVNTSDSSDIQDGTNKIRASIYGLSSSVDEADKPNYLFYNYYNDGILKDFDIPEELDMKVYMKEKLYYPYSTIDDCNVDEALRTYIPINAEAYTTTSHDISYELYRKKLAHKSPTKCIISTVDNEKKSYINITLLDQNGVSVSFDKDAQILYKYYLNSGNTGQTHDTATFGLGNSYAYIAKKIPKIKYICQAQNRIFGVSPDGRYIYASMKGDVMTWTNYSDALTYAQSVAIASQGYGLFTGLIGYRDNILAWKENTLYRITGSSPTTYDISNGIENAGCIDYRSIAHINDSVFFLSYNGFMMYSGGSCTNISQKLNKQYISATGTTDGYCYYTYVTDIDGESEFLLFDTRYNTWHKYDDISLVGGFVYKGYFYFCDKSVIYCINKGDEDVDWYSESCKIDDGVTYQKNINMFLIKAQFDEDSEFTVEMKVNDGEWIKQDEFKGTGKDEIYECSVRIEDCDFYQIRLSGTGQGHVYGIYRRLAQSGNEYGKHDFSYGGRW